MRLLAPAALLLDEIARAGSIRRAAERLNASASAVNRQVLNLEAEVGVALFERLPRGMRLTAAGELLVGEVRRWRREEERAQARIREMKGLQRGQVTVGAMECFATSLLPRAVAALQARHPRVVVDLFIGGTEQIVDKLGNRAVEVALCFNPPARPHVVTVASRPTPSGLVVGPGHPLAGRTTVTLADCAGTPFVVPDRSLGLRAVLDEGLRRAGADPLGLVSSNSTGLMKAMVREGACATILSLLDVAEEVARGDLRFIPVTDLRIRPEELTLCVARHQPISPQAGVLIEILRDEMSRLPETPNRP